MLHTRFPLDAPMASVRVQGQSARDAQISLHAQGALRSRRSSSSRLCSPGASANQGRCLRGCAELGFATGRSRQASCMQCRNCSQCKQLRPGLNGKGVWVWEVRIQGRPVGGGLYPASSSATRFLLRRAIRYNTVRLSRRGRGQEFD
jgi:hypothetical protein